MASTTRSDTLGSTRKAPATPPTAPSRALDTFANPSPGRDYVIRFVIPEFTCNCPLTGQPDFAHFTIDMIADRLCVELKSLKLYFWSYRDVGAFHEAVTNAIVDDIVAATDPMRFTNHSCSPNARLSIRDGRIEFYALRDIAPGEELTCNYNHFFDDGFDFLGDRHL
jgi:7-cyano-7-deazaguanine reductase